MQTSSSFIRIKNISLYRADLKTRMPFRYGIAIMNQLPHIFVQLDAEINGTPSRGVSADHLPPKWFTKDPELNLVEEIEDMICVIRHAAEISLKIEAPHPFALWKQLYAEQGMWGLTKKFPPLLSHLGTSLIERALIDAYCRHHKKPFGELLKNNALGINLGEIHPELKDSHPSDWLPNKPKSFVFCRHTIGLSDSLEESDITLNDRLEDGLPQSLTACIQHYGVNQFKIKFTSDQKHSIPRLQSILTVLMRETNGDFMASLDGNESFFDVEEFRSFWKEASSQPKLEPLFQRILFVEQPWHRSIALGDKILSILSKWADRPPIIIDESDAEIGSFPRAISCGYAGTSHKNCKGVFRGVINACLISKLRRQGKTCLMSAEDLTTIGPVSLLQDLAVQAMLGNESVERNGHHYFRGLSFWPEPIQQQMKKFHGDLYESTRNGLTSLHINKGQINLGTVNAAPFGISPLPDLRSFTSI